MVLDFMAFFINLNFMLSIVLELRNSLSVSYLLGIVYGDGDTTATKVLVFFLLVKFHQRLHSSFYLVWSTLNRYSYIIWDNCV
jgi:hypothetical protein